MSVHYIHPTRLSRAMRDHDAAAHRNAIDAADRISERNRIVRYQRIIGIACMVLSALIVGYFVWQLARGVM